MLWIMCLERVATQQSTTGRYKTLLWNELGLVPLTIVLERTSDLSLIPPYSCAGCPSGYLVDGQACMDIDEVPCVLNQAN